VPCNADMAEARRPKRWRTAVGDRRGNVALMVALMLPALLMVGLGAIELNQVQADQRATQNVADAAALMGAGQMAVTPSGAAQRAQAFAQAQLGGIQTYAAVTVSATAGQASTMTVQIDTQRASFFGSLFPPGGFHTRVMSVAQGEATTPLCVLNISSTLTDQIHLTGNSQLQAGACLVHSNQALTADAGAAIQADTNEAGTVATGPILNAPRLLAPSIADPFSALNVNPTSCASPAPTTLTGTSSLPAGIHTGPVNIAGNATATLMPGDHYFCQGLNVSGNSSVTGTDVDMVFDKGSNLNLSGAGTTLTLGGRQSGPLAGFVIIADRNYNGSFNLQSDFIKGLTGTVYVPTATLTINGSAKAGDTSPWTVIVAENLQINGGAQLVINSNYSLSSVPVPTGVGNLSAKAAPVKLVQ
jgi:Flp pilus assembly protein TadG